MKKILGLAFGLMISAFTFSQSPVSFAEDLNSYSKANATVYHFTFDNTISAQDITDNAQYYTDYFTVASTASGTSHTVVITMVQADAIARKVIMRYLTTFQVQSVNVGGNDVALVDFMD